MDRLTVKKIIETNLKRGKFSKNLKSDCTLKTYNNFIDAVDKRYKLKVCNRLSQLDIPIILIGYHFFYSYPVIYCFENNYYIFINSKTIITSDLEEVLDLIDKHFYN